MIRLGRAVCTEYEAWDRKVVWAKGLLTIGRERLKPGEAAIDRADELTDAVFGGSDSVLQIFRACWRSSRQQGYVQDGVVIRSGRLGGVEGGTLPQGLTGGLG